jgi:hypothetical protein
VRIPHPLRGHPALGRNARDAFWAVALGLIAAYAFFVALGAFAPGDVFGVTLAVAVLAGLWAWRAWATSRHGPAERDRKLAFDRERRGF